MPTVEDVLRFLRQADVGQGVSTSEIIAEFQRQGYAVDKDWFWDTIAPELVARDVPISIARKY